jgi:hypothetical protein
MPDPEFYPIQGVWVAEWDVSRLLTTTDLGIQFSRFIGRWRSPAAIGNGRPTRDLVSPVTHESP